MRYLLDTNVISFLARNRNPTLRQRVAEASQHATLCTSVITEAELLYGLVRIAPAPRLEQRIRLVLEQLTILPWTSITARTYATLRADLERAGRPIATLDLLIAAHALAEYCTLLSNDVALLTLADRLSVQDWS